MTKNYLPPSTAPFNYNGTRFHNSQNLGKTTAF
jgi:hypothetical protein